MVEPTDQIPLQQQVEQQRAAFEQAQQQAQQAQKQNIIPPSMARSFQNIPQRLQMAQAQKQAREYGVQVAQQQQQFEVEAQKALKQQADYQAQSRAAEDYNAAVQTLTRAAAKGKLWAHAAYGSGVEKQLAEEWIKSGVPPAAGGKLDVERSKQTQEYVKQFKDLGISPVEFELQQAKELRALGLATGKTPSKADVEAVSQKVFEKMLPPVTQQVVTVPEARQTYGQFTPLTNLEARYYGSTATPTSTELETLKTSPYASAYYREPTPLRLPEAIKNINIGKPLWAITSGTPTYRTTIKDGAIVPKDYFTTSEMKITFPSQKKGTAYMQDGQFIIPSTTLVATKTIIPSGTKIQNVYDIGKGLVFGFEGIKTFRENIGNSLAGTSKVITVESNLKQRGTSYYDTTKEFYTPEVKITQEKLEAPPFYRQAAGDIFRTLFPASAVDVAMLYGGAKLFSAVPTAVWAGYGTYNIGRYTFASPEKRMTGGYAGQAALGFLPLGLKGATIVKTKAWDYPAYNVKTGEIIPMSDIYIKQEGVTSSKRAMIDGQLVDVVTVRAKTSSGKIEEVNVRAADLQAGVESLQAYRLVTRGNRPIYEALGFKKPSYVGKGVEVKYDGWGFRKTETGQEVFGRVEKTAKFSQEQYNKNLKELTKRYLQSEDIQKLDLTKQQKQARAENLARQYLRTTKPQDILSYARAQAYVMNPPERFMFAGAKKDMWISRTEQVSPTETIKTLVRKPRTTTFEVAGELSKTIPTKEGYYTSKGKFVKTWGGEAGEVGAIDVFRTSTETRDLWKKPGKQITREEGVTAIRLDINKPIGVEGVIQLPGRKTTLGLGKDIIFQRYSQFDIAKDITMPRFRKGGKISKSESGVNVLSYNPRSETTIDFLTGKVTRRVRVEGKFGEEAWQVVSEKPIGVQQETANFFKRIGQDRKKSSDAYIKSLYETPKVETKAISKPTIESGDILVRDVDFAKIASEDIGLDLALKGSRITPGQLGGAGKIGDIGVVFIKAKLPEFTRNKFIGHETFHIKTGGDFFPGERALPRRQQPSEILAERYGEMYAKSLLETPKPTPKPKPEGYGIPRMTGGTGQGLELPPPRPAPSGELQVGKLPDFSRATAGAGETLAKMTKPITFKEIANIQPPTIKTTTGIKLIGKIDTRLVDKTTERLNERLSERVTQKINLKMDNRLNMKLNERITERLNERTTPNLEIRQVQRLEQRQVQRLNQRVTHLPVPIPRPVPPPTFILPSNRKQFTFKKPLKGKLGVFQAELRRRGKFVTIGKAGTAEQALLLGKQAARSTLGASIRVRGEKGYVQLKPSEEFRMGRGKEAGITIVQRAPSRIKSIGEIKEIKLARRGKMKW